VAGKYLPDPHSPQGQQITRRRIRAVSNVIRSVAFLLLAVVILLNLFTHVFQVVRYNGEGMDPSLKGGQILVLRKTKEVSAGDIIAFYYNNQILVRRAVCLGGDQVSVEKDGQVYVNGAALEESYLTQPSIGQCNLTFPYHVPAGHVFVMGDNRAIAMDSRLAEIGPVPTDRIIGTIILAL